MQLGRSTLGAGPLLFPKLGDASLVPVDSVTDSSSSKVSDLAMLLSILSSLVLIFRS